MSDYEHHRGKLKKVLPNEGETFEQMLVRLNVEDEYETYVEVDEELYEIYDHEEQGYEADQFCHLSKNDGELTFVTRFYNGGTCLTEMIADSIREYNN